ncbi:MAG TPA: DUF72 domain-containing protein, partial [Rectinemataceae bacterium]|nr:DUF72 domain-containing protein [Rectinemataceae bacterium]
TCKVSEEISLTHKRSRPASKELVANPGFLSTELFARYLERIEPMLPQLDAIMLEFEYLNREKMPSPTAFLDALDRFSRSVPAGLPLAVEPRNKNFLTGDYFRFLGEKGWIHVFSEKLYMPHAYDVYASFGTLVSGNAVIRLLGGDRAAIEKATAERWDAIVDPKPDKAAIVDMSRKITLKGGRVIININNHYEGSAPLTAAYFQKAFAAAD